jgi:hypothetical protein
MLLAASGTGVTSSTLLWGFVAFIFLWMAAVGFAYWRSERERRRRSGEATNGSPETNWPGSPSLITVERTAKPHP